MGHEIKMGIPAQREETNMEDKIMAALADERAVIEGTLEWFRLISSVPHGSWNEKAAVDLLESRFAEIGWSTVRDEWNNLMAYVPATPGLEDKAPVVLQGHIDMVCAVADGSGYVPERDPVNIIIEGDIIKTDGRSSLGSDCSLADSLAIWLMQQEIPHGPVRILLTAIEEQGLVGAKHVPAEWLEGCANLVNIDGASPGHMTIACAGGWREAITRKMEYAAPTMKAAFELTLEGFQGGHSGGLIHLGRGNPIRLITYFLGRLRDRKMGFELAALKGGSAYNALPQDASAVILTDDGTALAAAVEEFRAEVKKYYKEFDPNIVIGFAPVPVPERVFTAELTTAALDMGAILHHGVYAMMDKTGKQVASSGNLGMWKVNDKDEMEITTFIRCKSTFDEGQLAARHAVAARLCGFSVDVISHPGWDGSPDSALVKLICEVYNRRTGGEMVVSGTHAGLEPSVLGEKNPGMEMVSIGPELHDLHSITEWANLASLPGFARLLADILAELAK